MKNSTLKSIYVVVFQRGNLPNNCFHVDFLRKTVFGLYTLFIKIMAWLQGVKKARHDLHLDTSKSRSVRVEWRFYEEKKINLIWNRFSRFSRSQLFFLPACYSFFLATPGMFGVKYVRGVNLFFIFGFFSRHEECRPSKPEIILCLTFVFKQSVIVYSVCRFRTGRKNKNRTGRTVLQSVNYFLKIQISSRPWRKIVFLNTKMSEVSDTMRIFNFSSGPWQISLHHAAQLCCRPPRPCAAPH